MSTTQVPRSGSGLYFYLSQWQSGKITACHPKGLRFDSRTGHLGCGHYVVRSCTLSCFHSYPRLKLTFTIIAMQKSRSHPPFIHYSRFYISLFIDFFYAKENHFLQKIYFKIDLWMFSHRGAEKAPMCPIGLNLGFTLIKMKKTSLKIEYNSIFWCKIFLKSWCILYFMIYLLRPIMQLTIWSRLSNSFD